jgi:hypothetical protein
VTILDAGGGAEGLEDINVSISGPAPASVTLGTSTATATNADTGSGIELAGVASAPERTSVFADSSMAILDDRLLTGVRL